MDRRIYRTRPNQRYRHDLLVKLGKTFDKLATLATPDYKPVVGGTGIEPVTPAV